MRCFCLISSVSESSVKRQPLSAAMDLIVPSVSLNFQLPFQTFSLPAAIEAFRTRSVVGKQVLTVERPGG